MKDTKQIITDLLIKVKSLDAETYKDFLNRFPFHHYSFYNSLIIAFSGGSQVAGFHTWVKMNRHVRKGEKAIYILAPKMYYSTKKTESGEDKKEQFLSGFIAVPVFDIAQTEGQAIEKGMTTGIKTDFSIDKMAEYFKLSVRYTPLEIASGGYIQDNNITLNNNLSEMENKGTFIHELSHYLMGHTTASDSKTRDIKEQEAETLTFLICRKYGVERKSEFYLKAWACDDDILKSLKDINRAYGTFLKFFNIAGVE
jgi:antirestriction protein ArdC